MRIGQVVSFEMLMITTIMLVIMGLILPNLVSVKELVSEGENRKLAEKYLNSLAHKAEMAYVMGDGAVIYEYVHASSIIEFLIEEESISVSVGGYTETRNVNAKLQRNGFNVSVDDEIMLEVSGGVVHISSS